MIKTAAAVPVNGEPFTMTNPKMNHPGGKPRAAVHENVVCERVAPADGKACPAHKASATEAKSEGPR